MVGMSCGEQFVSGGRVFVEVMRPAVCLVSNKTVYCACVADCSVES